MYHGPACGLHWPGSRGARPPPQPRPASARRCAGPCRLQPCGSSSPPRGAWVLEPAESATTSAWRRGRTAAPPQWALNGSVARPECVTQPGAPQQAAMLKKPDARVAVHPPRHRLCAGVVDGRRRLKHLGRHLLEALRIVQPSGLGDARAEDSRAVGVHQDLVGRGCRLGPVVRALLRELHGAHVAWVQ
jgi:hypothetical protein